MEIIKSGLSISIPICPSELLKLGPKTIKRIIEEEILAENIEAIDIDNVKPLIKKIIRRVIIGGDRMPKIHKGFYVWFHDDVVTAPTTVVIDGVYLKTRLWIAVKGRRVEAVDFAFRGEDGRYKWVNHKFYE